MNTIRSSALFIMMAFTACLYGQKKPPYITPAKGFDVGINITSVVTSFTGNESQLEAEDLPIFLRWTTAKSAFRLGLGAKGESREFFDNITFSDRKSKQQAFFMKAGIELHTALDNRMQFYYGLDAVGSLVISEVFAFGGTSVSTIKQNVLGLGASTFVGMRYFVGSRFYLSTEANLMYLAKKTKLKEAFDTGTIPQQPFETETNASEFSLSAPIMLYINYRLK